MTPLVIVIAALSALSGMVLLYAVLQSAGGPSTQQRQMSIITGQQGAQRKTSSDNPHARRANLAKRLKAQAEGEKTTKNKKETLSLMLVQAGFPSTAVAKFWLLSVFSCAAFIMLGLMLGQNGIILGLFAITGLLGFPKFVLRSCAKRRQKKFMDDFADGLEAMVRLLKAGMPVGEAVAMVAREFTGPLGDEMSRMYDEQKIGITLAESALAASKRMPLAEMQMFATGVAIQQQTGSSLSEILTNLSKLIRARFRLKRKVAALSAEAKASAIIIGSLPILVSAGLYAINPTYMIVLFTTTTGKILVGCAVGWMSVGILVMRQMINFKI